MYSRARYVELEMLEAVYCVHDGSLVVCCPRAAEEGVTGAIPNCSYAPTSLTLCVMIMSHCIRSASSKRQASLGPLH